MALETELAYFIKIKQELLKHYEGKFALIVGEQLVGTFDTQEAAYTDGVAKFGNVPMLIKRIERDERIESVPAMSFGLIHAHT